MLAQAHHRRAAPVLPGRQPSGRHRSSCSRGVAARAAARTGAAENADFYETLQQLALESAALRQQLQLVSEQRSALWADLEAAREAVFRSRQLAGQQQQRGACQASASSSCSGRSSQAQQQQVNFQQLLTGLAAVAFVVLTTHHIYADPAYSALRGLTLSSLDDLGGELPIAAIEEAELLDAPLDIPTTLDVLDCLGAILQRLANVEARLHGIGRRLEQDDGSFP